MLENIKLLYIFFVTHSRFGHFKKLTFTLHFFQVFRTNKFRKHCRNLLRRVVRGRLIRFGRGPSSRQEIVRRQTVWPGPTVDRVSRRG